MPPASRPVPSPLRRPSSSYPSQQKVLDVEMAKDGLDLYFADKNTAASFVSFLGTVVPTRTKTSRKLVSEDRRNNIHRNQHTIVVEIAPLCKVCVVVWCELSSAVGKYRSIRLCLPCCSLSP